MPLVEANLELDGVDEEASVLSEPCAGAGRLSAGAMMAANGERGELIHDSLYLRTRQLSGQSMDATMQW